MVTLYEDVTKLLLNERNEHRRLSASFSILVKEVKEKAPVMAQQRKEHERVLSECIFLVLVWTMNPLIVYIWPPCKPGKHC